MALNPFALAFARNLPKEHPISALVTAHMWMMIPKNKAALVRVAHSNCARREELNLSVTSLCYRKFLPIQTQL